MGHDYAAEEKLRIARARAMWLRPYFAHAIYGMIPIQTPHCPTMGVDAWSRLYYNPKYIHRYTSDQIATVFIHEVGHRLRNHHERAASMGVTWATWKIANSAMDAELNDDLRREAEESQNDKLRAMDHLPGRPVYPERFGCEEDRLFEYYYHQLLDQAETITFLVVGPDNDFGEGAVPQGEIVIPVPNCGSGAHNQPQPWEHGEPTASGVEGVEEADWEDIQRRVAQDIRHRQKNVGDVPGGWVDWADGILRPRRIPWDQELAGTMRWAVNDVSGMVLHSYKRPSRRQHAVPDAVLPSMRRPQPFVVFISDTSGSMSEDALRLTRGVVQDVCNAMGARVAFLATDADVHGGVQYVQDGRAPVLAGRGGTNMGAGMDYALKYLRPKPDVMVVTTDCATPWPSKKPPGVRVIVCAVEADEEDVADVPDWARLIRVELAA